MSDLEPPSIPARSTASDDPRLGQWLQRSLDDLDSPGVVILGFPSDEGVERNGGRIGASKAPDAIRKQLYSMTPGAENYDLFEQLLQQCVDVGNVKITGDLDEDQQLLGNIVAGFLEQDIIPIILGGGHETAFGHFLGYAHLDRSTAVFNLDAHTDVRPLQGGKGHSGSSFRQALEHNSNCAERYLVGGLQPHSVAQSHLKFLEERGSEYLFRDETNITSISGLFHNHESERLMVSFDIDSVDQSQAPGVSAPCANGLPSDLWLTAAYLAGLNEQVTSFDLCEVNPKYDLDDQTARLAALTIWHFLLGLSQR